jgi:hypothetical protein
MIRNTALHPALHRALLASILTASLAAPALAATASPPPIAPAPDTPAALERTLAADGWSPRVLYELGSAYAASGHPGPAILAFERAQLLAPRDAEIRADLSRVREAAGLAAPPPPSRIEAALGTLTSDEWTWLAIAAGILACTGTVALAWSIRRGAARTLLVGGVAVGALAISAAIAVAPSPDAAIVVRGDLARIAPFAAADGAFTAPEGEQVSIEQQRGDYVYVRDGDREGWLPRLEVERIATGDRALPHA